jgi:hypothetical protein
VTGELIKKYHFFRLNGPLNFLNAILWGGEYNDHYNNCCSLSVSLLVIDTGEEVLHEGWSSYDNLFGVLMITVTEFLENVTDFCGKLFYILGELT